MMMKSWLEAMRTKYIIFDLDDTLAYEIEYLKSAYREIAGLVASEYSSVNSDTLYEKMFGLYQLNQNVFEFLENHYPSFTKEKLLSIYRNHYPNIEMERETIEILNFCKAQNYKLGLITDGYSITQRNKLKALKIESLFDKIIISEEFGTSKPDIRNYQDFQEEHISQYFYIADNPKDFITPNELGWVTVCLLDKGNNIHPQNFNIKEKYLPKYKIQNITDLKSIIQKH